MPEQPTPAMQHECAKHPDPSYVCRKKCECRCPGCLTEARRYRKRMEHRLAKGQSAYVDAAPAREHLQYLLLAGSGMRAPKAGGWWFLPQAKELGLAATQLRRIHAGEIRRVWPKTLDAILSLSAEEYDSAGHFRDMASLTAIVNALLDKGWNIRAISRATGFSETTIRPHPTHRRRKVKVSTLETLRQLLSLDRPPEDLVAPPRGGWDAWWNHRPWHAARRHHTRVGCWRRGCRVSECVLAYRAVHAFAYNGTRRPMPDLLPPRRGKHYLAGRAEGMVA